MIKGIIFDFGSVIYKTNWEKMCEELFDKFGINVWMENMKNDKAVDLYKLGNIGKAKIDNFIKELNPKVDITKEMVDFYKKMYIKHKIINNELLKLVKELKKKYILFAFTDIKKEHYESNLEFGIYNDFKEVYTSFKFNMLKSQDGAFDKLKKELLKHSLLPKECVFIDDHLPNIEQAKKSGFHTIHYEEFPNIENLEKDLMRILDNKDN
ncbi:MAG: HAD-IA family hydrolase [Nanoarchaeota archaeon]